MFTSRHNDDHAFGAVPTIDRKSTRLNSSHLGISYAVFCLKKKNTVELTVAPDAGRLALQDPRRIDRVAKALRAIGLDPVGQVVEHRIRDMGPDVPEVLGGR